MMIKDNFDDDDKNDNNKKETMTTRTTTDIQDLQLKHFYYSPSSATTIAKVAVTANTVVKI